MSPGKPAKPHAAPADGATPFRFYDNRQKYLAFVNTCNEKSAVAHRAALELKHVRPTPPALSIFDAGMGDATVLARILRHAHAQFPTVPVLAVAIRSVRAFYGRMQEPKEMVEIDRANHLFDGQASEVGDALRDLLADFSCAKP